MIAMDVDISSLITAALVGGLAGRATVRRHLRGPARSPRRKQTTPRRSPAPSEGWLIPPPFPIEEAQALARSYQDDRDLPSGAEALIVEKLRLAWEQRRRSEVERRVSTAPLRRTRGRWVR